MLGWEAVGRIDTPTGYCTGTLIARDIVLTAAHCLFDRASAAPVPATAIRFRAGYHHGQQIADRRVTRWIVSDGYTPGSDGRNTGTMIARDIALLQLDHDIFSAEADPFQVADTLPDGARVSVLSYGQGRDQALSREPSCEITHRYHGGVFGFDCDVTFGSSGAPVFARIDDRLRIVSVISAVGDVREGRRTAYGMVLPEQVTALMRILRRDAARPQPGAGARRITVGERASGGARFVRPGGS
ncbi:trypsin-like serine peptidase [Thalassococcus arenae]|uniref:trypsin-like serine peptidase n=1 Tax=Thalassococcus arenae TaxID=2851652 RepID=UPI0020CAC5A9|nr:trypsin-like peptidase domain-containing protein [Thalassococcus arenae]